MRKTLSIALKIITSIPIAAIVLLAIVLASSKLAGLQLYTVLSGSMEPEIMTGALLGVKEVDPETLEVNDVITFKLTGTTTATHRIIELVPDENDPDIIRFRTKGDNNDDPDNSLVDPADVIGTPVYNVPHLGYAMSYVQSPQGICVTVAVGALLLLLMLISDVIFDVDEEKKKKKEIAQDQEHENENQQ